MGPGPFGHAGLPDFAASLSQRPSLSLKNSTMAQNRGNLGAILIIVSLPVAAYWYLHTQYGYDLMPALRGIHLGLPLVCGIAAAIVLILWAGKFFGRP